MSDFTLQDFRNMLGQSKKLDPLNKIIGLIPGMGKMISQVNADGDMKRLAGIIDAMTPAERRNASKIIDQSRRRRIAAGAGVNPYEVNALVSQFNAVATIMHEMASMGIRDRVRKMRELRGGLIHPPDDFR